MLRLFAMLALFAATSLALAADALAVNNAWVRATAPGQEVGAAYMQFKSTADLTLTAVESPAAESVEIHSMTMKDGVMEMRMLEKLALPAGKTVSLEPGGFHLMLFGLKQPLKTGEKIAFTLRYKDAAGKSGAMKIEAPVRKKGE